MAKEWAKSFYNSKAWRDMRRYILHRDHFTCRDCKARAEEVHHIVELTPDNIHNPNIALGEKNLVSLCGDCHKRVTKDSSDLVEGYVFDGAGYPVPLAPPVSSREDPVAKDRTPPLLLLTERVRNPPLKGRIKIWERKN